MDITHNSIPLLVAMHVNYAIFLSHKSRIRPKLQKCGQNTLQENKGEQRYKEII